MSQSEITDEEWEAYSSAILPLGSTLGVASFVAARDAAERMGLIEYDEYIVAYPRNLTDEILTANHAAGLPKTREKVVRCESCRWFWEGATPHDDGCPHFCVELGIDLPDGRGFCAWAESKEEYDRVCHGIRRMGHGPAADDVHDHT